MGEGLVSFGERVSFSLCSLLGQTFFFLLFCYLGQTFFFGYSFLLLSLQLCLALFFCDTVSCCLTSLFFSACCLFFFQINFPLLFGYFLVEIDWEFDDSIGFYGVSPGIVLSLKDICNAVCAAPIASAYELEGLRAVVVCLEDWFHCICLKDASAAVVLSDPFVTYFPEARADVDDEVEPVWLLIDGDSGHGRAISSTLGGQVEF